MRYSDANRLRKKTVILQKKHKLNIAKTGWHEVLMKTIYENLTVNFQISQLLSNEYLLKQMAIIRNYNKMLCFNCCK